MVSFVLLSFFREKGKGCFGSGVITSDRAKIGGKDKEKILMPQLDQFTYFTQFFWSCLFFFTFYVLFWPLEVSFFFLIVTKPKLLRFLSLMKWFIYMYIVLRIGFTLYLNLSSLVSLDSLFLGVFPSPAAAGASTYGGSRPLEIDQGVDQDLIWENLDAQEREARAREDARISRWVEAITTACEKEEAAMIEKAHLLLQQKGVFLEDPRDVTRALGLALYDDWQHDIDGRLQHFRKLNRNFGKARCSIWNVFIDALRDLGNTQVNARHKVD